MRQLVGRTSKCSVSPGWACPHGCHLTPGISCVKHPLVGGGLLGKCFSCTSSARGLVSLLTLLRSLHEGQTDRKETMGQRRGLKENVRISSSSVSDAVYPQLSNVPECESALQPHPEFHHSSPCPFSELPILVSFR